MKWSPSAKNKAKQTNQTTKKNKTRNQTNMKEISRRKHYFVPSNAYCQMLVTYLWHWCLPVVADWPTGAISTCWLIPTCVSQQVLWQCKVVSACPVTGAGLFLSRGCVFYFLPSLLVVCVSDVSHLKLWLVKTSEKLHQTHLFPWLTAAY